MSRFVTLIVLACTILSGVLTASATHAAVSSPFSETFDDDTMGTAPPVSQGEPWQEQQQSDSVSTANWTIENDTTTPGAVDYRGSITTQGNGGFQGRQDYTALEHTGLGGSVIEMSFDFEIGSASNNGDGRSQVIGKILADSATDPGVNVLFFVTDDFNNNVGKIGLRGPGFAGGSLGFPVSSGTIPVDTSGATTYRMDIFYDDTLAAPVFSATVTNLSTSSSVTDTLVFDDEGGSNTPASGNFFGLGVRADANSGATSSLTADFDNITLTIPAPPALGMGLAGFAAMVLRTRRRKAASGML